MSLSPRLSTLKASQLKYAAFLMGIPSTGSKPQLESAIRHHIINRPRLEEPQRIVSVDMGIRNLGICVLQTSPRTRNPDSTLSINITDWKRAPVSLHPSQSHAVGKEISHSILAKKKPLIDPTSFNPSNLSKTAVDVAFSLLSYNPNHILIERQRFRSGGASAVQEWTLRVNALESMIWAALETMRRSNKGSEFPHVHEVSPARVAKFWCARPPGYETVADDGLLNALPEGSSSSERNAKRTVDKKEKIAVVRSWLSATDATISTTGIDLDFSVCAQATAEAFLAPRTKSSRPRHETADSIEPSESSSNNKLDDLADCLLQGVAWVRWLANHERIERMFEADFKSKVA